MHPIRAKNIPTETYTPTPGYVIVRRVLWRAIKIYGSAAIVAALVLYYLRFR